MNVTYEVRGTAMGLSGTVGPGIFPTIEEAREYANYVREFKTYIKEVRIFKITEEEVE